VIKRPVALHLRQAPPGGGGADTVLYNYLTQHDRVTITSLCGYLRKPEHDLTPLRERIAGIGIPAYDLPGNPPLDFSQLSAVAAIVRERGVTILHCHDAKARMVGWLVARRFPKLRLVATLHGFIVVSAKARFYHFIDCMLLRRFDATIVVSAALKEKGEEIGVKKLRVIPNSMDTSLWPPPPPKSDHGALTIGYVGRLSAEKGPLDFVTMAAAILKQAPTTTFLMAGEGNMMAATKALAKELGVTHAMEFVGFVKQAKLPDFYARLDALALPSYTEGTPLTLLEAGALEIPVVATRVGGCPEVVEEGENGFLVEPGQPDKMAALFLRLIADAALRRRMGVRGREIVRERYSLDANVPKIEALYHELMAMS